MGMQNRMSDQLDWSKCSAQAKDANSVRRTEKPYFEHWYKYSYPHFLAYHIAAHTVQVPVGV